MAERDGSAVTIYRSISRGGVIVAGSAAPQLDAATQRVRLDAQAQLDAAADAAPPGVNPETCFVHGEPGAFAGECAGIVGVLLVGSRGYGPLQRVFAGSVSQALMLDAKQPVVVIPRASIASQIDGRGVMAPVRLAERPGRRLYDDDGDVIGRITDVKVEGIERPTPVISAPATR